MKKEKLLDAAEEMQRCAAYIRHLTECVEDVLAESSDAAAETAGKAFALCDSIRMQTDKIDTMTAWITEGGDDDDET